MSCCPWIHGLRPKIFKLVWQCHQLLSVFLAKGHLIRISRQSRRLPKDKAKNQIIPGAVHRSPGIYLTTEENSGKPQLGDSLRKAMRSVIVSNGVPYLQMKWLDPTAHQGRRRKDGIIGFIIYLDYDSYKLNFKYY